MCGCGTEVTTRKRGGAQQFVSGHNLKCLPRTKQHNSAISAGQRRAWQTKRQRRTVGAKTTTRSGYVIVKVVPGKGAWRLEHVMVAEAMLGRKLKSDEVVHHINGDRADNRESNLFVCRDRAHHNEIHRTEAVVFRKLLECGFVAFRNGVYEAVL